MNRGICAAHLREERQCPGCRGPDTGKPVHCIQCGLRGCKRRASNEVFCGRCDAFPCGPLVRLDRRYRKQYGMSMIENLGRIMRDGLDIFIESEAARWRCGICGGILNVHKGICSRCGVPRKTPAGGGEDEAIE
ncbi:MAG: DUF3795 domain-containing protein [Spirochaetes bacterium]|nr:DUF3795 domain-containing protein [Spirochaetota bacterium]